MGDIEYAYAKLNLGLKILGRRKDGFHDILSVFQTVNLCDRLVFEAAAKGACLLSCDNYDVPAGDENIVCRAVSLFRSVTGIDRGVCIDLQKRIPIGAGLGGGSSDAAAVLRVLNRIWDVGLSYEALCQLGAKLGSDVPFFLQKGTAVVTGRGERLQYVPWHQNVAYVLVYPGFKVSTGWAYANFKKALTGCGEYDRFLNSIDFDPFPARDLLRHIENDFLPLVMTTYPEVGHILLRLTEAGALVSSMSGSGSTLYGVFDSQRVATSAYAQLKAEYDTVFLCFPEIG